MAMDFDTFIIRSLNHGVDYDGVAGVQCVDLIMNYLDKVFDLKGVIYADAHHYYNNFNNYPVLTKNFTRIKNTPEFIPQRGDICIFNKSPSMPFGHICIATGKGNLNIFQSYDQNFGRKECYIVTHNYNGFLGVLRYKGNKNNKTKYLDTTGVKSGDDNFSAYIIKRLLSQIPLCKNKMDKNGKVGKGTIKNINALLKAKGYSQNGIAGKNFVEILIKELKK